MSISSINALGSSALSMWRSSQMSTLADALQQNPSSTQKNSGWFRSAASSSAGASSCLSQSNLASLMTQMNNLYGRMTSTGSASSTGSSDMEEAMQQMKESLAALEERIQTLSESDSVSKTDLADALTEFKDIMSQMKEKTPGPPPGNGPSGSNPMEDQVDQLEEQIQALADDESVSTDDVQSILGSLADLVSKAQKPPGRAGMEGGGPPGPPPGPPPDQAVSGAASAASATQSGLSSLSEDQWSAIMDDLKDVAERLMSSSEKDTSAASASSNSEDSTSTGGVSDDQQKQERVWYLQQMLLNTVMQLYQNPFDSTDAAAGSTASFTA
ncbi:MAG: hypothetical protein ACM3QZ_06375 [Solirubrobacterales bacterium]